MYEKSIHNIDLRHQRVQKPVCKYVLEVRKGIDVVNYLIEKISVMFSGNRCLYSIYSTFTLWQYQLWSFQTRRTKLERFLLKNQQTHKENVEF